MKLIAKMYRGQYRAIEEALKSWKADHDEAMAVRDFEEVIRRCLELHDVTNKEVKWAWETGFQGGIVDPEGGGECVLRMLDAGVEAWETVTGEVEQFTRRGYAVEGADKLAAALNEIRAARDDFAARWPFVRKEDIERGASEIAAGKCVSGEDLLRELQGHGG